MRHATAAHRIAPTLFPHCSITVSAPTHGPNISRRRIENSLVLRKTSTASDEFGDADVDDEALVKAVGGGLDFEHIDDFAEPMDPVHRNNVSKNMLINEKGSMKGAVAVATEVEDSAPVQLPNGRWSCNHKCKDKEACKHYCCKHGMDRPPKKAATKRALTKDHQEQSLLKSSRQQDVKMQTKLRLTSTKRKTAAEIEELDLTHQEKQRKREYAINGPHDYRDLHNLHRSVQKKDMPPSLHSVMHKPPAYQYNEGTDYRLSFLAQTSPVKSETSSEYGDLKYDELPDESSAILVRRRLSDQVTSLQYADKAPAISGGSETFGDDDSMFSEAIVGLADSQDLQGTDITGASIMRNHDAHGYNDEKDDYNDVDFPIEFGFTTAEDSSHGLARRAIEASDEDRQTIPRSVQAPFIEAMSSPEQSRHFKSAAPVSQGRGSRGFQQVEGGHQQRPLTSSEKDDDGDIFSDLLNSLDKQSPTFRESIAAKKVPPNLKTTANNAEGKKKEPQKIPGSFQDLQPWLFQEFGDIVELVDE